MIGTLTNIVSLLTANGDTFLFDYGKKGYVNLAVDENTKPFVIYDTESSLGLEIKQSGFIGESGTAFLSFFYKSELDWTPKQHYDNCILPSINAVRQFISLCQDSDLINAISIIGKGKEMINVFDLNASGVSFTFEIELNVDKSVCENPTPKSCLPVTITDGLEVVEVESGGLYTCVGSVCDDGFAINSDLTYSLTVPSGTKQLIPDTTYNIYLDGVLNQSVSLPTLGVDNLTITLLTP